MATASASRHSATSLENAAEAAYLAATSPSAATSSPTSDQEFEFSIVECQRILEETVPHYVVPTEKGPIPKSSGHPPERNSSRTGRDQAQKSGGKGGACQTKADAVPSASDSPLSALSRSSHATYYKTLVIYGPTGNGKTHLVDKLVHKNPGVFSLVVSHTTRKRREGELSGITFHFVSQREMSRQIAKGNFIEYVHISKPTAQAGSRQSYLDTGTKFDSVFDLTAADSPAVGGETFGTSCQALHDARQQGKPCVILNVSSKGAKQLKEAGIEGSYVLLQPSKSHPSSEDQQGDIQPDFVVSVDSIDQAYSELQQYASKLVEDLDLPPATRHQMLKEEWDSRPTVVIRRGSQGPSNLHQRGVTFIELLSHCQSANRLSRQLATVRAEQHRGGLTRLFGRNKLSKRLQSERNLVLAIALTPLDDQEPLHLQTLQVIYQKLTGNSINCGRFGHHWEEIGFQGVDPADDLRGVGFFGLMQLVLFLESPSTFSLAREIYRYSADEVHFLPFCILSLNMTQVALQALQDGDLSKVCNKKDQVVAVVNDFYIAVFYHYYQLWRTQSKTIHDLGPLVQEVGRYARRHVKTLLREMERYFAGKESELMSVFPTQGDSNENPFTQIEDMQSFTATVVLDRPE